MKSIITGYFGSGKTEIAMQMARDAKQIGHRVTLVDLDIVNPYFTSSAHGGALEAMGIHVVSPGFANTNVDAPRLLGGIHAALLDTDSDVIVDLGGDAVGATVLGSILAAVAPRDTFCFLLAVNVFRPFTRTPEEIIELMETLQTHARLRVTGFINNANLLEETEPNHLFIGETVLGEVAKQTGKPILFHSGTADILAQTRGKLSGEAIVLQPRNSPVWLRNGAIRA